VFLHAPVFGELAQKSAAIAASRPRCASALGIRRARYRQAVARAYEWFAHVPQAERAASKAGDDPRSAQGTRPKSAPKDERAIYDFIQELYKGKRVSAKTFGRVLAFSASRRPSSSRHSSAITC